MGVNPWCVRAKGPSPALLKLRECSFPAHFHFHFLTVGLIHDAGAHADCRRVAAVSGEFLPKQKISGGVENIFLLGDKNICLISWLRRWQKEEGPCSLLLLPYTLCPLIRGTHWRVCFKKLCCCKIHHSLSPGWQFYCQKSGGAIQWCIWYILTGKPFIWIPE